MRKPRVSVICISYNQVAFLPEAIESVLEQDFADFELLLVDDGSTDGSSAIARAQADRDPRRIRWLEHPGHANRGPSATRNLGLFAARGEFVTFLDGDDRFKPGKLREQVALLDVHPSAGMVCGGYIRWLSWSGGEDQAHLAGPRNGLSFPPDTTLEVFPLGWSKNPTEMMIRRDIAIGVGGFEEAFPHLYDDQAFLAKAFLATPVLFSDNVWLDYRVHGDSHMAGLAWHELADTHRRFLEWFGDYLEGREVAGKQAILDRLRVQKRRSRGLFVPWVRDRMRVAWARAQKLAGREDLFRRHCLTG